MKWIPEWLPETFMEKGRKLRVRCDDCGWKSNAIAIPSRIFQPSQVSDRIVSELGDQKCECLDPLLEALDPNLIEVT